MDVQVSKDLGMAGGQVLDKRARHLYGANCYGASWHGGNSEKGVPAIAKIHLADGQDPADAEALLAAVEKPTCVASGLDITTDVGELIDADETSIAADPDDEKYVKVVLAKDNSSGSVEVFVLEKTTGAYADLPAGKTHISDLKEFSVPAAGTELVEVNNWI